MPIITSVTRPAESGTTNSGEFAINGLPIQVQATGNTIGNDLKFDGDGLSLAADTAASGAITGVTVNGGPVQNSVTDNVLYLSTPIGTLTGIVVNGVTGSVDSNGTASVSIVTANGTVNAVVVNGTQFNADQDGVVTLANVGTASGATINGGPTVQAVNGVINLTGVGRASAVVFGGNTYTANEQGVITLPSNEATIAVASVSINGNAPVLPNGGGNINLGTVGTVRTVVVNGVSGTTNTSTGVASLTLPLGGVNSVSLNGGAPTVPTNGNIDLNVGTVKSVTVNGNVVTPVNGNVNLGSLSNVTGVTVNNVAATVTNGNAQVTIPVGTGTVTGVKVNGGAVQSPVGGVVSLTIAEATDVVKRISVGGQVLTPVNGTLTLTLPSGSSGSVNSVSVNGGAAITADALGNVALTGVGSVSGVTVNGGPTLTATNGVVALTNVGTISGVTVNGGAVQTPTNGALALTGVGRVNRVVVNGVEATVNGAGLASVTVPVDSNAVKTISLNGGAQLVPVNGNVDLTVSGGSTPGAITGITVNGGSQVVGVAGVAALTGIGTVKQIRLNGAVITPVNGEVVLNTGTISGVTVNGGAPQPISNGVVNLTVAAAQAGAQSVTINGGAPVAAVAGNIALTGVGNVTGATVNGGSVVSAVAGRLNLTGVGTVTTINVNGSNYTPVNGVVTLPASSGSTTGGVQTISLNGGAQQPAVDGNINLLVGTLSGVTVNGTAATVTNGRANLTLTLPTVPIKGVSVDGGALVPDAQGVVNVSLAGLAKSVTFLGETQNVTQGGTLTLPTTVGTVKAVTVNGGAQIVPVNGVVNLTLATGMTSGIQSLLVNGQAVTPSNGVASFVTPQGTVTGITLNGSAVQAPVNGVVALNVTAAESGVQTVSVNGTAVTINPQTKNAAITGVVTSVSVNGGTAQLPNSSGLLSLTTPTNFIKTISVNGGTALAPDAITGNYNLVLPSGSTSGVQAVRLNGGAAVYPTNGIVDLSFSAATNFVKSIVINGVAGSPNAQTGVVDITIPAGDSNVKSVSINGGTKYSANTEGNINITASLGTGTVSGIQVNGAAVQSPNGAGTLVLTGIGTVTGATVNGGATVYTATAGKLNLTGIGTISSIQANGQTFAPVGASNTVNLGTLGTVNTISINGGTQVAAVAGNVALTGIGTVTGATVNGGTVVAANNGVLNLTVPAGVGGVQAVAVNGGAAVYPTGGIVNLNISGATGTVTGVTVNAGAVVPSINGVVALTGLGTVTGATVNGGATITAAAGKLNLTGIGTVTGVTFNGGLVQTPTAGVVALTYSPPTDTVKSVIVNGGAAQTPVNGVLSLTIPTGSTTPTGSTLPTVRSVSVNGGLAVNPNSDGLLQLSVGTVKSVKLNGNTAFPDPTTGLVDLGTITVTNTTTNTGTTYSPSAVTSVTFVELTNKIATSALTANTAYLLTDYRTTHYMEETTVLNTGPVEPLLMWAVTSSSFAEECYSPQHPKDTIYYSPVNDDNRQSGATKGIIYRRVDTSRSNDLPYDFRAVKFRRWKGLTGLYTNANTNGVGVGVTPNVNDFQDFLTFDAAGYANGAYNGNKWIYTASYNVLRFSVNVVCHPGAGMYSTYTENGKMLGVTVCANTFIEGLDFTQGSGFQGCIVESGAIYMLAAHMESLAYFHLQGGAAVYYLSLDHSYPRLILSGNCAVNDVTMTDSEMNVEVSLGSGQDWDMESVDINQSELGTITGTSSSMSGTSFYQVRIPYTTNAFSQGVYNSTFTNCTADLDLTGPTLNKQYFNNVDSAPDVTKEYVDNQDFLRVLRPTNNQTFFGLNAGGPQNVSAGGDGLTFIGSSAGLANRTNNQTFVGIAAGVSTTTGANNTYIGAYAGQDNITGQNNTYIGHFAGRLAKATQNVGVGPFTLQPTTGWTNTAVGYSAGSNNIGGSGNTFYGASAGIGNVSGHDNVALGRAAGPNTGALNNTVSIGTGVGANADYAVVIGGALHHVGIGIQPTASKLAVSGLVESTSGGFKFPDGTVQLTAASSMSGDSVTIVQITGTSTSSVISQDHMTKLLLQKLTTPAGSSATININAGLALAPTLNPIQATVNITALTATLVDGGFVSIPITASGANRTVTVPVEYVPLITGSLRTMTIASGLTRRVLVERLDSVYYFGFL